MATFEGKCQWNDRLKTTKIQIMRFCTTMVVMFLTIMITLADGFDYDDDIRLLTLIKSDTYRGQGRNKG